MTEREVCDYFWNTKRFPILFGTNCDNWHIYSTEDGSRLASIAVVPGCLSSTMGNPYHVATLLRDYGVRSWRLTPFAKEQLRKVNFLKWTDIDLDSIPEMTNESRRTTQESCHYCEA